MSTLLEAFRTRSSYLPLHAPPLPPQALEEGEVFPHVEEALRWGPCRSAVQHTPIPPAGLGGLTPPMATNSCVVAAGHLRAPNLTLQHPGLPLSSKPSLRPSFPISHSGQGWTPWSLRVPPAALGLPVPASSWGGWALHGLHP